MKKALLLVLILFGLQNYGFSQRLNFIKNLSNTDMMLGFTISNWAEYPDPIKVKVGSNRGFDLAILKRFDLVGDNLSFGFGLGLTNINIHTNVHPWGFLKDGSIDSTRILDNKLVNNEYSKNKLSLTYLEVPLELQFRTKRANEDGEKKKNGFVIAVGFRAGWGIDAHTKLVQDDFTTKYKDWTNISRLRYGPTVRIGFGRLSLYGRYDLTSTFDAENAPDYNVYSVGLYLQ